jgi:pimeloyl-ACP methyl ester carboxylesterase
MADDLEAVLESFHINRALVGGESMGAATALLFALRHPERVDRLMLTGPAFGDGPNPGREDLARDGRLLLETGIEGYLSAVTPEWAAMGMEEDAISAWSAVQRSHNPTSLAVACRAVADWVILPNLCLARWRRRYRLSPGRRRPCTWAGPADGRALPYGSTHRPASPLFMTAPTDRVYRTSSSE